MNQKKILIADDEFRMRKLVGDFLKREGFSIIEAENGKIALESFKRESNLDLVILDIMMPEYDGWTVCKEIRKSSKVPILMLTAKSEEFDELLGFEMGADEYITKPFSPKVLVARVTALLRRLDKEDHKNEISFPELKINKDAHTVYVHNNSIDLSPKEYELLLYLVENKNKALNRDQILNYVWGIDYYGDDRTVDTHINRIRTKLEDLSYYIQTVRGYGYKFEVKQ